MTYSRAWRNFRRMQDSALLFASLIYLGAVLHAWTVLPGSDARKAMFTLAFPGIFLAVTLAVFVTVSPARAWVRRYVWMSFKAGFGQTVGSVLSGLGLLVFAAGFIYLQVAGVAKGGRYPAGVFSGYAAGIGIILAQALQVRRLERDPEVRREIQGPETAPSA
ncbi:MAG TPA: hypothetical protein VG960_00380 [Caulobacteraceae bacterium]|nr:hypothetical protein [Caulobacteraceae bacterium]